MTMSLKQKAADLDAYTQQVKHVMAKDVVWVDPCTWPTKYRTRCAASLGRIRVARQCSRAGKRVRAGQNPSRRADDHRPRPTRCHHSTAAKGRGRGGVNGTGSQQRAPGRSGTETNPASNAGGRGQQGSCCTNPGNKPTSPVSPVGEVRNPLKKCRRFLQLRLFCSQQREFLPIGTSFNM